MEIDSMEDDFVFSYNDSIIHKCGEIDSAKKIINVLG